jgi:aryl-alcohol dehydrogenase-like predicted oxidoreductase
LQPKPIKIFLELCVLTPKLAKRIPTCLQDLVEEGKVKAIGISEADIADARKIHSIVPVSAVEVEWSLSARGVEVREFLSQEIAVYLPY